MGSILPAGCLGAPTCTFCLFLLCHERIRFLDTVLPDSPLFSGIYMDRAIPLFWSPNIKGFFCGVQAQLRLK